MPEDCSTLPSLPSSVRIKVLLEHEPNPAAAIAVSREVLMRDITVVQIQFSVDGEADTPVETTVGLHGHEARLARLAEDVVLWTRYRRLFPGVSKWTAWVKSVGNIVGGDRCEHLPPPVDGSPEDETGTGPVVMHVQVNTERGAEEASHDVVVSDPGPDSLEFTGLPPHGSYWLRHRMAYPWVTRWTGWDLAGGESVDGRRFSRTLRQADTGGWILPRSRPQGDSDLPWDDGTRPPPPAALWVGRDSDNSPDVELWWKWREMDLHLVDGYRGYRAEGLHRMVDNNNELLGEDDIRLVHEDRDIPDPRHPGWTDTTAIPTIPYTYAAVSLSCGRTNAGDRISTGLVAYTPGLAS